ncbi:MAG: septation protein SpoVG family protein [Planctomycetota bacterium]
MNITEVRIKLLPTRKAFEDRLRAFCTVTFDSAFVIRDLKIIEGQNGFFVAMPSRKLTARCSRCSSKNHLRARYCNDCGAHLKPKPLTDQNRLRFHADIAHPINAEMRKGLERAILAEYEDELERSKSPDYRPQTFPDLDYDEPAADVAQS